VSSGLSSNNQEGRVAVNFGEHCLVESEQGELVTCHAPRNLGRPVCGDRVRWIPASVSSQGILSEILPRTNQLQRHDVRARSRTLAANLDLMLVVLAATPAPELALIDRYLVAAELLKLKACLVFNKADLLSADDLKHWRTKLAPYEQLDYRLIFTSLKAEAGIVEIRALLEGLTGIVVGQSGVGKSTLVSTLVPDLALRTQQLSEASGTGQHTTSTTRLYRLPDVPGCIIDSPGVRDFRLWSLTRQELAAGFREFRTAQAQCRFQDCRHLQEPDCEIRARVKSGAIASQRYASYCQLVEWMGKDHA
jgi:ribosome biogenesis GTPase